MTEEKEKHKLTGEDKHQSVQFAIIIVLSLVFGIIGGMVSLKFEQSKKPPMLYSLNLRKIVGIERHQIANQEIKNPTMSAKTIKTEITKFISDINSDAHIIAGKNSVIIVSQAVIGGSNKDITTKVENELIKQGDLK
jgi:hypothetical protein